MKIPASGVGPDGTSGKPLVTSGVSNGTSSAEARERPSGPGVLGGLQPANRSGAANSLDRPPAGSAPFSRQALNLHDPRIQVLIPSSNRQHGVITTAADLQALMHSSGCEAVVNIFSAADLRKLRQLADYQAIQALRLVGDDFQGDDLKDLPKDLRELELDWSAHIASAGLEPLNQLPLTSLGVFCDRGVGDAGAAVLARHPTLKSLALPNNRVGDPGAQALAASSSLKELLLRENAIGDLGAIALGANPRLELANLLNNCVGSAGGLALVGSRSIAYLDLGANRVTDPGELAIAVGSNTTLRSLGLASCNVGMEEVRGLAATTSVVSYDLRENRFGPEGVELLFANDGIRRLHTSHGEVGRACMSWFGSRMALVSDLVLLPKR